MTTKTNPMWTFLLGAPDLMIFLTEQRTTMTGYVSIIYVI